MKQGQFCWKLYTFSKRMWIFVLCHVTCNECIKDYQKRNIGIKKPRNCLSQDRHYSQFLYNSYTHETVSNIKQTASIKAEIFGCRYLDNVVTTVSKWTWVSLSVQTWDPLGTHQNFSHPPQHSLTSVPQTFHLLSYISTRGVNNIAGWWHMLWKSSYNHQIWHSEITPRKWDGFRKLHVTQDLPLCFFFFKDTETVEVTFRQQGHHRWPF